MQLEAAQDKVNASRAEVHAKQRQLLQESRANAAKMFRSTTEAAPKEAPKAAVSPEVAPKVDNGSVKAPVQPQIDIEAEVNRRVQAALSPAQQQLSAAKAASDAKLKLADENPYEFLKQGGMDLDKWQARLMNGGEASAEEKFQREVASKIDQVRQENQQLRQQIEQDKFQQVRQHAINTFTPVAEEHFPLVAAKVGVAVALDELTRLSKEAGKPVDAEAYFTQLENKLFETDSAYLKNSKVAAKLGLSSVKSPKAEVADTPRTLSNRTTSSVGASKPNVHSWQDAKAAGRAMIQQLKAAGKL